MARPYDDDDFDPDDDGDFASMLADFEAERKDPKIGEKVKGRILSIGDEFAFVDLGGKSEGTVASSELLDADGDLTVNPGDEIEALVTGLDESENFILRVRPGQGEAETAELKLAYEQKLTVEGTVETVVKGGLEVTLGRMRAFCPVSQIDRRYVEDPSEYVGQKLEFRIRRFEAGRRTNIVLSRRVLLEEEAERRAAAVREKLSVGSVHQGTVTSIASYGAFVDLGGLEGLLHVSELSHQRGVETKDVLEEGQSVEVQVVKIEPPKKEGQKERISLSMRALQRDPWDDVERRFPVGTTLNGRVMRLEPYGAFVELAPGLEGLVHISRLGGKGNERHARELVELGQMLPVRVLQIEPEKRRVSLAREADEKTKEQQREAESYLKSQPRSDGFGSLGDFFKKSGASGD